MIAVVQRVSQASVAVDAEAYHAAIGPGLCVLLGVEAGDDESDAAWMAGKLARLRIFADDQQKMNRSVQDVGGAVLLISQFTLAGDCSRGNRPSFVAAAEPVTGRRLYELVARLLQDEHAISVKTGVFGAMMQVALVNDGPVTVILRSRESRGMNQ
jgi:D-tyrosyl-tRNA(Tyr) deacylase